MRRWYFTLLWICSSLQDQDFIFIYIIMFNKSAQDRRPVNISALWKVAAADGFKSWFKI